MDPDIAQTTATAAAAAANPTTATSHLTIGHTNPYNTLHRVAQQTKHKHTLSYAHVGHRLGGDVCGLGDKEAARGGALGVVAATEGRRRTRRRREGGREGWRGAIRMGMWWSPSWSICNSRHHSSLSAPLHTQRPYPPQSPPLSSLPSLWLSLSPRATSRSGECLSSRGRLTHSTADA